MFFAQSNGKSPQQISVVLDDVDAQYILFLSMTQHQPDYAILARSDSYNRPFPHIVSIAEN